MSSRADDIGVDIVAAIFRRILPIGTQQLQQRLVTSNSGPSGRRAGITKRGLNAEQLLYRQRSEVDNVARKPTVRPEQFLHSCSFTYTPPW